MALLYLKSNNPKFSYVISKNPETGLLANSSRLGTMFGYFPPNDPQVYVSYFKDAPNEVSYKAYKEESFEHMNSSRFNSALFPIDVISDFYSSLIKGNTVDISEYDKPGFKNELSVNLVRLDSEKYVTLFTKYIPDFKIEIEEKSKNNYKVTISTHETLQNLINYTALFFVFNILKNTKDFIEINPDQFSKYLTCLGRLEFPYFMKYVFKVNLIRSPRLFKANKDILEKSVTEKIEMVFGSTAEQRLNVVLAKVPSTRPVVEIGCSDGYQTIPLAKRLFKNGTPIYAIDTDLLCRDKVEHRANRKDLSNVKVLESFEAFKALNPEGPFTVMMVEVIEHLEIDDATTLFKDVLEFCKTNAKRLLMTTPNYDFNQFYKLESYRHDDHRFEFTEQQFKDWVKESAGGVVVEHFGIGDVVDGHPTTLGLTIEFGEEK